MTTTSTCARRPARNSSAPALALGSKSRRLCGSHFPRRPGSLERVLDTLKRTEPSPHCKWVLGYLGNLKTPESRAVLKLLAEGDTDPWLAEEAKAALYR